MPIELIRNQRDKNSGELYATPPNGKCPVEESIKNYFYRKNTLNLNGR